MELIKAFREKQQLQRQAAIEQQAEDIITVSDFGCKLYIAYNGTPLIPIEEDWTSKEILEKLSLTRSNYINAKIKQ